MVAKAPPRPSTGPKICLSLGGPPTSGEHEQDGDVSSGGVEDARRIDHGDSRCCRRLAVDVVDADRHVANHAQTAARRQHRSVDLIGQQADDGIDVSGQGDELISGQRAVASTHDELVTR